MYSRMPLLTMTCFCSFRILNGEFHSCLLYAIIIISNSFFYLPQ